MLVVALLSNIMNVVCLLLAIVLTHKLTIMAKTIEIASLSGPSKVAEEKAPTNWNLCILCQTKTNEPLSDPVKYSKKSSGINSYQVLARRIQTLSDLDSLPSYVDASRLDHGEGIETTLMVNGAKWHKMCYSSCNDQKIERAAQRKRKLESSNQLQNMSPVKKKLRTSISDTAECSLVADKAPVRTCFFCDSVLFQDFHRVETLTLDKKIRKIANDLSDSKLLMKLSCGDMAALDAVYHKNCLTSLYNRHRKFESETSLLATMHTDIAPEHIAFAELIAYIEQFENVSVDTNHIFKLSDLVKLYHDRIVSLGGTLSTRINNTKLKEQILATIPNLEANKSSYEVILSFKNDIGDALLCASSRNNDKDAVTLLRAAGIVRKEIFSKKYEFKGSLIADKYQDLPKSLNTLVKMILSGADICHETGPEYNLKDIASSMTQLLVFNAVKRVKKDTKRTRHPLDRETMLPLYIGLTVHNKTRRKDLIDILYEKGLSVSYDRVLHISTSVANAVITMYEDTGVICPPVIQGNGFITGNLDNIDHNPTSTTARDSFHGTAISLSQHYSNVQNENTILQNYMLNENGDKSKIIKELPGSYTEVPPVAVNHKHVIPPIIQGCALPSSLQVESDKSQYNWLNHVKELYSLDKLEQTQLVSWSAYFASKILEIPPVPAVTALLPLFRDNAHSFAMIKHGMDIIMQATQYKNPLQTPVLTVDQPLYAIAKQIQWLWPDVYGESKYVVMMGGLHIEMAFLKVLGDWLFDSGWITAITTAGVTTAGRADSIQKGASTSRGQWAHQVMAAGLFILKGKAYKYYADNVAENAEKLNFKQWSDVMDNADIHPQFAYWNKTMNMEILFLQFMKSQREANFDMYVECLGKIVPWMFAMDHIHYARWLTVHTQDLLLLQERSPDVHEEFKRGHFVTHKTKHRFSGLAHDQIHEQQNAIIKGDGGFVGLTENPDTLRRWMVAAPETTRILTEASNCAINQDDMKHHEETQTVQKRFHSHVRQVVETIEDMGNPFEEDTSDLYTLDTKVVMSPEVIASVKTAESVGKAQYKSMIVERLSTASKSFYDTIKKNSLPLFRNGSSKKTVKVSKVKSMKSDIQLFSRMYISCQVRDGDLDTFFEHENHAWPPSLAENNMMRLGSKADLMKCLEREEELPENCPLTDVKILDGAAIVQSLDPNRSDKRILTFDAYAQKLILPYISKLLIQVNRIDIIWDTYRPDSLKVHTRHSRGTGDIIKVSGSTRIPVNWKSFLRVDENKTALYEFLATQIKLSDMPLGKLLLTTFRENVLVANSITDSCTPDLTNIEPCTHEEADYRMLLHAADAFKQGYKRVMLHVTDTDVLVLSISTICYFDNCELWLAFGHSKHFRYIPAHSIANRLGKDASLGLPFFHALSGCDTVSAFAGIGKKTAFTLYMALPHLIPVFKRLSSAPHVVIDEDFFLLERYIVLLYSKTSTCQSVNEARKYLFSQGNRQIENIPPTRCALIQHVRRAAYQAGHVWGQALIANPELPSPADWGWAKSNGTWVPFWSTNPEAAKSCRELVKCSCKNTCTGRCKCIKANLLCTQLCNCEGHCIRE